MDSWHSFLFSGGMDCLGRLQARVNHQVCLYELNPAGGGASQPTRGRFSLLKGSKTLEAEYQWQGQSEQFGLTRYKWQYKWIVNKEILAYVT